MNVQPKSLQKLHGVSQHGKNPQGFGSHNSEKKVRIARCKLTIARKSILFCEFISHNSEISF